MGKESKQSVLRWGKKGVLIYWCKQCSFLVNFRLKCKDINKSNKRQTYTYGIGVLRKKCSPKWANFTLKQGENCKKKTRRIIFQEWFLLGVTEFPIERTFSIGWWCYITPVLSNSCLNIDFCQLFHWPKNVNKPNLVFLHIQECTIQNTFLTNINFRRLSDIASHCKKYINIL